ncbi:MULTISPECIES: hypothetical protein [unclassified Microbacterium]|uniref:hypothetical protein n=1 Tax=unclassified Microbacterium TaxID=2609290 RepID=UPI00301804EC
MRPHPAALAAPLVVVALAACSPGVHAPEPIGSSTPQSATLPTTDATVDAALARYSTDLPTGYSWPEQVPPSSAEMIWACLHLDAAWAAIDAHDQIEADRLVAQVYDGSTLWDSDPPVFETGPTARDWGWHGICTQQLGLIDYPVRGLDEWSPSP